MKNYPVRGDGAGRGDDNTEAKMRESNGFTLIELLLVMVIIGILAGMVVVNYSGYLSKSKIDAARGDIHLYEHAIELYMLDNNDKYPPALSNLMGGKKNYVTKLSKDPWGTPYVYVCPGKHNKDRFDLSSNGPDEQPGTADDITNRETNSDSGAQK